VLAKDANFDKTKRALLHNFQCPRDDATMLKSKVSLIDVVVQCKLLGEGYDNQYIAISAFVSPCKSLGTFAQYHGRAIRRPDKWLAKPPDDWKVTMPQAMYAYCFYPVSAKGGGADDVQEIVDKYRGLVHIDPLGVRSGAVCPCEDESEESLFAETGVEWKTFHGANSELAQMGSHAGITMLKARFDEYHTKYAETCDKWSKSQTVPAVIVAQKIFNDHINLDLNKQKAWSIIDFGCGRDGLFECKLAELVSTSNRQSGGKVTTLALDTVPLACATSLLDASFECETSGSACANYLSVVDHYSTRVHTFDFAVFCLSFTFDDCFGGLSLAAKMLKLGHDGRIYIVLEMSKFFKVPKNTHDAGGDIRSFLERKFCDSGFKVDAFEMLPAKNKNGTDKKADFGLVQLINVSQLSDTVQSELDNLTKDKGLFNSFKRKQTP